MGDRRSGRADLETHYDVSAWLAEEAELLDAHRYHDWLTLLADDARYRMPVAVTVARRSADGAVLGAMDHFDEDVYSLRKRVERLEGKHAWTEDPPSRARRFVTNIRVGAVDNTGELEVRSYLLLYRSRGDDRAAELVSRERVDRLRRHDDGWLLVRRDISVDEAVLRTQNLALFLDAMGLLDGKVIVATGGGSGIGRAAVDAFVAEGACVAVLELDPAKCEALDGTDVVAIPGDATSAAANAELVATAVDRWGRIDAAVTFVGVFDLYTPLTDLPADDAAFDAVFGEVFDLNVRSPLLTARAAIPALRASRGTLIFTLSSSSFYAGRGGPLYVASKFALRGAVVQLAHELAPEIRVNGVAPGGTVATDLRGPRSLGRAGERLDDRPGRADGLRARTPLQVALTGADHAGAYVFLASDRSIGMTGEILRSDGGLGVR